MAITRETHFGCIERLIEEDNEITRMRLWQGYEKYPEWLRKRELDKPFWEMLDSFHDVYSSMKKDGITDKLAELAKDCQTKASLFADKSYYYEDCWNPRLDRELTQVLGHDYTVTEWLRVQAESLSSTMRYVVKHYNEAMDLPE